jgi:uncharacterized protein
MIIREAHFPGRAPLDAYGNGGFRFADMSHRGSILCLPSGIHGWEPADAGALRSRISHGCWPRRTGSTSCWSGPAPNSAARRRDLNALREAGISADPMSTGTAVRTYNVLLAEDRQVAAALVAVD